MSNRVVMVDDLFALIDGVKQWIENQLADGAGTKTTTFGTSAGVVDGSDRASVAATTSPPSAGTTASGAGSVAAAVEALRAAINDDRLLRNGSVPSEYWYAIQRIEVAVRALLALDVPGIIAARERGEQEAADMLNVQRSEIAKLREQLADAQKDAHYAAEMYSDRLADAKRRMEQWRANFEEMAANADRAHEALRVEREACDKIRDCLSRIDMYSAAIHLNDGPKVSQWLADYDTRRAAEKTTGNKSCPTPSGASADTGANGAGSSTGSLQVGQTTNAPSSGSSTASAPPPAEKPDPMKYVRMTRSAVERTRDNGLNPNWWCAAAIRLCDAHEALLAAYDAERAKLVEAERRLSEAYATVTDCREAVNIRREDQFNAHAQVRALQDRLAKIAAILSDDSLENPQKIGRALRVAEGKQ